MYKLKVSVTSMLRTCPNHEIGDYFIVENDVLHIPGGKNFVFNHYRRYRHSYQVLKENMMKSQIGYLM